MTNKHESDVGGQWPATGGATASVGLGFLPAAPGTVRSVSALSKAPAPDVEHDDEDLLDTEDCEPVIRSVTRKKPRSLAERIGRPSKSRSALEVLKDKKAQPTSKPVHVKNKAPVQLKAVQSAPVKEHLDVQINIERILRRVLGSVKVEAVHAVENSVTIETLWSAHKARALAVGDVNLAVVADLINQHNLSERSSALYGARIQFSENSYAAFIDIDSDVLLGLLQPADAYLAGLKLLG